MPNTVQHKEPRNLCVILDHVKDPWLRSAAQTKQQSFTALILSEKLHLLISSNGGKLSTRPSFNTGGINQVIIVSISFKLWAIKSPLYVSKDPFEQSWTQIRILFDIYTYFTF